MCVYPPAQELFLPLVCSACQPHCVAVLLVLSQASLGGPIASIRQFGGPIWTLVCLSFFAHTRIVVNRACILLLSSPIGCLHTPRVSLAGVLHPSTRPPSLSLFLLLRLA